MVIGFPEGARNLHRKGSGSHQRSSGSQERSNGPFKPLSATAPAGSHSPGPNRYVAYRAEGRVAKVLERMPIKRSSAPVLIFIRWWKYLNERKK
jgi:hypothetical protein